VDAEAHDIHGKLRPPSDFVVAEVAARQWGVASLKQLLGLGLTRGAIEHRSRMGRLHRVHRGVYAVGHTRLGSQGRALAAVLACGERAVLSHRSAGAWCDLLAHEGARVEVTVPHGRHALPGVLVHQSRSLAPRDTIIHDGMPITSLARTLLDLAATVKRGQLERALAQAERLQLYDHAAITDVLARANGHRGQRRLGEATAREPKWTRNEFEVRLLKIIRGAGLPEPDTNPAFVALDHGRCEPDLYWPAHRLIVETDGWESHRTRAAFESDRAKDAALTASGYRVVRFTWRTPDATIERRLRALLQPQGGRSSA
jgi:hypothetical protein